MNPFMTKLRILLLRLKNLNSNNETKIIPKIVDNKHLNKNIKYNFAEEQKYLWYKIIDLETQYINNAIVVPIKTPKIP